MPGNRKTLIVAVGTSEEETSFVLARATLNGQKLEGLVPICKMPKAMKLII
jgi:hypothetical protein